LKSKPEPITVVVFVRKTIMASHKPFTAQRIAQCLAVLDQFHASGMNAKQYAGLHQHSYDQLRAWLRNESRWRAASQHGAKPAAHPAFLPIQIQSHPHVQALASSPSNTAQPIRIECASLDGKRTASVHFPLTQCQLSAQWLAAYMSA
jgi:hypothetical protein